MSNSGHSHSRRVSERGDYTHASDPSALARVIPPPEDPSYDQYRLTSEKRQELDQLVAQPSYDQWLLDRRTEAGEDKDAEWFLKDLHRVFYLSSWYLQETLQRSRRVAAERDTAVQTLQNTQASTNKTLNDAQKALTDLAGDKDGWQAESNRANQELAKSQNLVQNLRNQIKTFEALSRDGDELTTYGPTGSRRPSQFDFDFAGEEGSRPTSRIGRHRDRDRDSPPGSSHGGDGGIDLTGEQSFKKFLTELVNSSNKGNGKSEKLGDPTKYNGDKKNLKSFLLELSIKLQSNDDRFRTERQKVLYAYTCTVDAAKNLLSPHMVRVGSQVTVKRSMDTVAKLIAILEAAYGDQDEVETAGDELAALKQNKQAFSWYISEFNRLMQILDYQGLAKTNAMKKGLSKELKFALSNMFDEPRDFELLCARLERLDSRIRNFGEKYGSTFASFGSAKQATGGANSHSNSNGNAAPRNSAGQFTSGSGGGDAMDLSAVNAKKKKRGRLSDEEKQRRRDNKLCLFCGSADHECNDNDCPELRKLKGNGKGKRSTNVSSARIEEVTDSESDDSEN